MNELITIVQYDYGYDLNFTLKDSTGVVVNLTNATITFNCQSISDNAIKFIGNMVTVNALNGTCKYTVQASDFVVAGSYTAQIVVNYASSTEIISFAGISVEVLAKLPQ